MTKRNDRPRRIGLGIALACWLGTVCVTVLALDDEAIPWRTDLHRAEIEARAQNRLLWVQFTGSWCPNCVRLEHESFVHPRVVGHARLFRPRQDPVRPARGPRGSLRPERNSRDHPGQTLG